MSYIFLYSTKNSYISYLLAGKEKNSDNIEKIACALYARRKTTLFFSYKYLSYELVNIMNSVGRFLLKFR